MKHENKNGGGGWAVRLALFAMGALALLPGAALADFGPFTPPATDLSLQMLTAIFGGVFSDTAAPGAFGAFLGVVSGAALFMGGIMAAYVLVAGTMQTAHDGSLLGKRWSSMWVPMRVAIGTALALPVKGGLCAATMLVAWIVGQSVGIANKGWEAFSGAYMTPGQSFAALPAPSVETLAHGMLRSATCLVNIQDVTAQPDTKDYYPAGSTAGARGTFAPNGLRTYGTTAQPNACGTVSTPAIGILQTADMAKFGGNGGKNGVLGNISAAAESMRIAETIADAHARQSAILERKMYDLAAAVAGDKTRDRATANAHRAAFAEAVQAYKAEVSKAALESMRGKDFWEAQREAAAKDGWLTAGAWGLRLAEVANAGASSLAGSPVWGETSGLAGDKTLQAKMSNLESVLPPSVSMPDRLAIDGQIGRDEAGALEGGDNQSAVEGWIKKLNPANLVRMASDRVSRSLSGKIRDIMAGTYGDSSTRDFSSARSPLVQGVEVGHMVLAAATDAGILFAVIVAVAPGGTAIAVALGSIVTTALSLAMAAGAALVSLAYIPFLIWFAGIVGWTVLVAEALISAPLWAVTHMHADGDGMAGGAKAGYSLLLSLALRPLLMVGGLVCATLLLTPLGHLLNMVFGAVIAFSGIGNSAGLLVSVIGLVVYAMASIALVYSVYKMINVVPDTILRWLPGVQGSGMVGQAVDGVSLGGGKAASAATGAGLARFGGLVGAAGGAGKGAAAAGAKDRLGQNLGKIGEGIQNARRDAKSPSKGDAEAKESAHRRLDAMEAALDQVEESRLGKGMSHSSGLRGEIAEARQAIDNGEGRGEANANALRKEAGGRILSKGKALGGAALESGEARRMRSASATIAGDAKRHSAVLGADGVRQMGDYARSLRQEADRIDPPNDDPKDEGDTPPKV